MKKKNLFDLRPDISPRLGKKVCLLSGRLVYQALADEKMILMAANPRVKYVIPGIMKAAQELEAVLIFEMAKCELGPNGWTGILPEEFSRIVFDYAEEYNFTMPFIIHGDHITVEKNTEEAIREAENWITIELANGYTSFALDPSFNPLDINIEIVCRLAPRIIANDFGLEVEVGEIASAGGEKQITTVEEAKKYITSLKARNIHPQLLAINNGAKHGNYLPGEEVHIDLARTKEIAEAIKNDGVRIAQHGITGTPLSLIGQFADNGIRKGNVGTLWQNIGHQGLPEDLFQIMKEWAAQQTKGIEWATGAFKKEIDAIGKKYQRGIAKKAYQEAIQLFKAFRAVGSARLLEKKILKK